MRQPPLLFLAPETAWWTPPAPPDLSHFKTIELDTETTGVSWATGDRPVGIAVGADGQQWYLPWGHRGGQNLDEAVVKRWAREQLRGKRIRNLHTKFDLHMMRNWGVDLRDHDNTFHDVAHSAALLDERRRGLSLDALARDELGLSKANLPALAIDDKTAIADLPAGEVAPYAMRDVELVARLAEIYDPRLAAENLCRVSQLEDDVIPAVVEIEANGMVLDLPLLHHWIEECQRLIALYSQRAFQQCEFRVNPDSSKHLEKVFERCHVPIVKTASDRPSFTAAIMKAAAEKHEDIRTVWRLGQLRDLESKYLAPYANAHVNGVLYPTLNQLPTDDGGTISGRFSCVRPNLQQVMGQDKHNRRRRTARRTSCSNVCFDHSEASGAART